jgi:hypothetical protein
MLTLPLFIKYYNVFTVQYRVNIGSGKSTLVDLLVLKRLLMRIEKRYITRGQRDCIKYIKSVRTSIYRHVAGQPSQLKFTKTTNGLPSILGQTLGLLVERKSKPAIQQILTILQVSYLMKGPLNPDLSPLTTHSTACPDLIAKIVSFSNIFDKLIFKGPELLDWADLHVSTSAGPNGPAVWACNKDLTLYHDTLITELTQLGGEAFKEYLIKIVPHGRLLYQLTRKLDSMKGTPKRRRTHRPCLRKIVAIPAPEGKTRVIAIFDYWSQTVLRTVHDWAFGLLKQLPTDVTFNQGEFRGKLTHRLSYHSFDLTSATDRFPIDLQEGILAGFIGKGRAKAWKDILIGQDFTVGWDKASKIRYACGQPMGAYSSWAIFAICHHIVVRYCASVAGYDPINFNDYVILGDDIVIANSHVAGIYETVINELGVGISETKSLKSADSYEFAKRFFHNNEEMTAFPLAAIVENAESISAIWSVLFVAKERGFDNFNNYVNPGFCVEFQRACGILYKNSHKISKDLEALHQYTYAERDGPNHRWALAHLGKSLQFQLPCGDNRHDKIVISALGASAYKYQDRLLMSNFKEYNKLRKIILYFLAERIQETIQEGNGSQAVNPIELEDIPILRITEKDILSLGDEMVAMDVLSERAPIECLRKKVTPVGDLSRVISRLTNTVTSSRQAKFVSFLRNEQILFNQEVAEELSGR